MQKKGIAKETDYKYEAKDGECRFKPSMRAASIRGYRKVQGEANIQKTLEKVGPLAVAIHASREFAYYRSGVFNFPGCSKSPNHAVSLSNRLVEN
jgi:Papain family cysteine protease